MFFYMYAVDCLWRSKFLVSDILFTQAENFLCPWYNMGNKVHGILLLVNS